MTKILIATPTPGIVKTSYMRCVIETMKDLARRGIECEFESDDGSDIVVQRNTLATSFLNGTNTHVLFVDSDMLIPPNTCARLIACNRPLVGCVYAKKDISLRAVADCLAQGLSFDTAIAAGQKWLVHNASAPIATESGERICQVDWIGFGAALIQREVFERMVSKKIVTAQSPGDGRSYYTFFSPRLEDVHDARHVSEDQSFCRRWRLDCGERIWAAIDITAGHVGDFTYGARSYPSAREELSKFEG